MIQFTAIIKRFAKQGEKTGWTYIDIPAKAVAELKPGTKTSFRVKGRLDYFEIEKQALLPMGEGKFILTLNATLRKGLQKGKGDTIDVRIDADETPLILNTSFIDCLHDEPQALEKFFALTKSHQLYFSKWIESAKTEATVANRIAMAVTALAKGMGFPEMLRANKKTNN